MLISEGVENDPLLHMSSGLLTSYMQSMEHLQAQFTKAEQAKPETFKETKLENQEQDEFTST